jgi:DNA-binding LytR/AlgR family response regulator
VKPQSIVQISSVTKVAAERPAPRRESGEASDGLIAVSRNGRVILLHAIDIDWIESCDNYVSLHCGKATHIVRATLAAVESRLESAGFLRLHRSALVNLRAIRELYAFSHGDFRVVLLDGTELTLKKTYRERLQSRLLFGCLGRCATVRV